MTEKQVEAYLVKRVKELGGLCLKFTSPSRVGVPDRVCILPRATVFWVEVKKEGGELSVRQERELALYSDLGHHTAVVYCKRDVDWVVGCMQNVINETAEMPGERFFH